MNQKRALPENSDEIDEALRPYRILVRPIISGVSSTLQIVGSEALDAEEKDSGTMAFSALLYQYGAKVDAGLLVLLWMAGVGAPRLAAYAKRKQETKSTIPIGKVTRLTDTLNNQDTRKVETIEAIPNV